MESCKDLTKSDIMPLLQGMSPDKVYSTLFQWNRSHPDTEWNDLEDIMGEIFCQDQARLSFDRATQCPKGIRRFISVPFEENKALRLNSYVVLGNTSYDQKPFGLLSTFHDRFRSFFDIPSFPENVGQEFVSICFGKNLFICGGNKASEALYKLDFVKGRWSSCASLNTGRSRHCMVAINNRLYALGGYAQNETLSSIEEYDVEEDIWRQVTQLVTPTRSAACVLYKGLVFVFGGRLHEEERVMMVQCFDPVTKKVVCWDKLPCSCSLARAVVIGDQIFIATGQGFLLRYHPMTKQFKFLSRQPIVRRHFGLISNGKALFVLGGKSGSECLLSDIHRYDIASDTWSQAGSLPQPMAIFGFGATKQDLLSL